jgi:hypothetical protein
MVRIMFAWMLGVAACLSHTGCILPFGDRYVDVPDPREKEIVTVVNVEGREVSLSDGRKTVLAGIAVPGNPDDAARFADRVKSMLMNRRVLVEEDGCARLEEVHRDSGHRNGLAIVLFPRDIPVPPDHADVVLLVINDGYAAAVPSQIREEGVREKYIWAEKYARENNLRIWSRERASQPPASAPASRPSG